MTCHLCGRWMTPVMNGPIAFWCSPCAMKQLEPVKEVTINGESYTQPTEGALFA